VPFPAVASYLVSGLVSLIDIVSVAVASSPLELQ